MGALWVQEIVWVWEKGQEHIHTDSKRWAWFRWRGSGKASRSALLLTYCAPVVGTAGPRAC
jgi:hypothetical protein